MPLCTGAPNDPEALTVLYTVGLAATTQAALGILEGVYDELTAAQIFGIQVRLYCLKQLDLLKTFEAVRAADAPPFTVADFFQFSGAGIVGTSVKLVRNNPRGYSLLSLLVQL